MFKKIVSMPHAALCVSGHRIRGSPLGRKGVQCRTRHYVCRDDVPAQEKQISAMFQCRTRHYVCRDVQTRGLRSQL